MTATMSVYDDLAALFAYPGGDYRARIEGAAASLACDHPGASEHFERFRRALADEDEAGIEELFTTTFDLNPTCCPEIGWQLFGERYDRGSFLVWMRGQLRSHGLAETGELPDHLTHVFQVLARMTGDEAERFATEAVGPAMDRMVASLGETDNPFADLLRAALEAVVSEFGRPKWRDDQGRWDLRADAPTLQEDGE